MVPKIKSKMEIPIHNPYLPPWRLQSPLSRGLVRLPGDTLGVPGDSRSTWSTWSIITRSTWSMITCLCVRHTTPRPRHHLQQEIVEASRGPGGTSRVALSSTPVTCTPANSWSLLSPWARLASGGEWWAPPGACWEGGERQPNLRRQDAASTGGAGAGGS